MKSSNSYPSHDVYQSNICRGSTCSYLIIRKLLLLPYSAFLSVVFSPSESHQYWLYVHDSILFLIGGICMPWLVSEYGLILVKILDHLEWGTNCDEMFVIKWSRICCQKLSVFMNKLQLNNSTDEKHDVKTCSLSLWRVVRGSKLMHLDLIHGLFIT